MVWKSESKHQRRINAREENVQVAPSILSADLGHLADELATIEGAGYVHFDAMDGHFVPNLTFGPGVLSAVKAATQTPVDAHLMIPARPDGSRVPLRRGRYRDLPL